MSLNIPNGFDTLDEHLNDLAARMQASHPYINSRSASGSAVEEVHDEAVHEEAVHDEAVHEEAVHDEAVHEEAVHDEAVHDEAVHEEEVHDEAVHDEAVHDEGDIIYERDLRYNNKRDIDFTNVPIGTKVHVFASRHSGGYSYIVEASYEATLANKKIAKHQALILMRDRCKEVHAEEEEDLALRTEISALRRMQSRTKKIDILEALAEGHARALEIYKDQQMSDNARVERSNQRLSQVYQFNTMLLDVDDDAIKNARYNVLKPSAGKKKKRSGQQAN